MSCKIFFLFFFAFGYRICHVNFFIYLFLHLDIEFVMPNVFLNLNIEFVMSNVFLHLDIHIHMPDMLGYRNDHP